MAQHCTSARGGTGCNTRCNEHDETETENSPSGACKDWPHPMFQQNQTYGTPTDTADDFSELSFRSSRSDYHHYMHAAHAMIYCFEDIKLWGRYPKVGNIMMQTRFDGTFGFPGGLLDKGTETPAEALNRELEEEIGLNLHKYKFTQDEHLCSHVHHQKKLVTHFYVKKVMLPQYKEIEREVLNCEEWGTETFGVTRVPLYTMDDGCRGLPVFLANRFAGNAKEQLLLAIQRHKILPESDLKRMTEAHRIYQLKIKGHN